MFNAIRRVSGSRAETGRSIADNRAQGTKRDRRGKIIASAAIGAMALGALAAQPANAVTEDQLASIAQSPLSAKWWSFSPGTTPSDWTVGFNRRDSTTDATLSGSRGDRSDGALVADGKGYADLSYFNVEPSSVVDVVPTPGATSRRYQAYSILNWDMGVTASGLNYLQSPTCLQPRSNAVGSTISMQTCNPQSVNQPDQQWIVITSTNLGRTNYQFVNVASLQANGNVLSTAPRLTFSSKNLHTRIVNGSVGASANSTFTALSRGTGSEAYVPVELVPAP